MYLVDEGFVDVDNHRLARLLQSVRWSPLNAKASNEVHPLLGKSGRFASAPTTPVAESEQVISHRASGHLNSELFHDELPNIATKTQPSLLLLVADERVDGRSLFVSEPELPIVCRTYCTTF